MAGEFKRDTGVQMRVLIVEDDAALAVFLKKGLQLEGHEVEWLGDGEAALEALAVRRPDLMVLDLGLPKLDGTEVLESLAGRFEGMSVLVLTGRNEVEVRVRCLNLGADDIMLKPFSFHELRARCGRFCGGGSSLPTRCCGRPVWNCTGWSGGCRGMAWRST